MDKNSLFWQDNSVPLKKKIRRIGKKINIACSKGRIERLLEAFRNRIKDFRVLVEQTEKLSERHPPGAASQLAKSKITEFTEVKAAANNLYTTFGQACTKHTEHQAYIGLQPTQWQSAQVNFILAFKQMALQSCPTSEMCEESEDMLWLTIESTIEESIQTRQLGGSFEMSNALNNTLKRDRETSPCCSPNQNKEQAHIKMLTKRVRFREDQTACGTAPPEASLSLHVPKSDSLLNLCSHKNFCNHIQRIVRQPRLPKDRCVGYLECRGNSKHMVYINSRKDTVTKTAQPTAMVTLSQLLKNGCGSMLPAGALLQDRKFKMGMQLATAVLQFHETCWLKESWSSDDIAVSDMRSTPVLPLRSETALYEPFANVSIRSQENKAVLLQDQGPVGPSYIRNRPLFNLGKILLELAFEKPFDELKEKEDLDLNVVADPDYFAAWKLQREVSAKLGIRYSEIVRKCINCDFGQGDDFTQERLQASFYQHVICELETCEQQALGRA